MVSNKEIIELKGVVEEMLPAGTFSHQIRKRAEYHSPSFRKMRLNKIRLSLGDMVKVEMTPYDLTKGRISFRY